MIRDGMDITLTKPQSCCSPCSKHAIASARLFLRTLKISWKESGSTEDGRPSLRRLVACSSSRTSISMSFSVASTAREEPVSCPETLAMTSRAADDRPALTSHRGVSGIRNRIQSCMAAGRAPSPTIHRHAVSFEPYSPNSQPTIYATTCPRVMKTTVVVTSRPL